MNSFVFRMPTRVLFGSGQLNNLHTESLPGRKALLVISNDGSAEKYGYLERVRAELERAGAVCALFDEVGASPTRRNVMDGAKRARSAGCDFVAALGGESVTDCAKGIALMMSNPGDIWDYSPSKKGGKRTPAANAAPVVAITTAAGTGSGIGSAAVISNSESRERSRISFPSMLPRLSVADTELMMNVPPRLAACQGMDAFFHAAETMTNKNLHPMAEMLALKAIELIAEYLPAACGDRTDRAARENVALAGILAGCYTMHTSAHAVEYVMSGSHEDMAHGAGLMMTAPIYYSCLVKKRAAEEPMLKMAKAMGVEHPTSGKDFIGALNRLIAAVGCADLKMSEYGITWEELRLYPFKIRRAPGGDGCGDPLPLSNVDYLEIYRWSYR